MIIVRFFSNVCVFTLSFGSILDLSDCLGRIVHKNGSYGGLICKKLKVLALLSLNTILTLNAWISQLQVVISVIYRNAKIDLENGNTSLTPKHLFEPVRFRTPAGIYVCLSGFLFEACPVEWAPWARWPLCGIGCHFVITDYKNIFRSG